MDAAVEKEITEDYILFQIAGTSYAVHAEQVLHIEMVERISPVPNTPPFIKGVVSLRGQVMPVISLRSRFHLEEIPIDLRARLVVIRLQDRQAALLVDTAREFIRTGQQQLHPLPGEMSGPGRDFLTGVLKLGERLALLVDLHKLLEPGEMDTLRRVQSPG